MRDIRLVEEEIKDLYLFLKKNEMELSDNLFKVLNMLQKIINERYTIQEIEKLLKDD